MTPNKAFALLLIGISGGIFGFFMAPPISYWLLVVQHGPVLTKISEKCTEEIAYKQIWVGPEHRRVVIKGSP